jgi:hypothetical protein
MPPVFSGMMIKGQWRGRGSRGTPPRWIISTIAAAAAFCLTSAHAQRPDGNAAIQQARIFYQRPASDGAATTERLQPPVNGLNNGYSAADADIGEQWMLKPTVPDNPFTARASLSLFYTDNVALVRTGTLGDFFAVGEVGLGYSRSFAPDWTLTLDAQQSFFRYDRYSEFDFESAGATAILSYQARQLADIIFSLQYALNRLTGGSIDDQLYLGNSIALAVTKMVPVTSATAFDLSSGVAYTFANPESLERAEFRVVGGFRARLARNFIATASVRTELFDYTDSDRLDMLQSLAIGARYDINEWFFVSASVSGTKNFSTQRVFGYEAVNAGATIAASIRF